MTPPAVSAPPRPAALPAGAPAPGPAVRARAPFTRRRPGREPLFTARTLAISVALHALLAIALLLLPERGRTPAFTLADDEPRETVQYLDVGDWGSMATAGELPAGDANAAPVDALGAGAADSALARLPGAVPFPDRVPAGIPGVVPGASGVGGSQGGEGTAAGTGGAQAGSAGQGTGRRGVLSPEYGDPRLVVTPQPIPERQLTHEERYQRHFEGRINALNDSIAGEADRRRRGQDWTLTDARGRRWGFDNGRVVVGGRSVRLPNPPPAPRDRDEEQRTERDQRREMDRQAETIERERYLRERARATRERENERRRREREAQGSP